MDDEYERVAKEKVYQVQDAIASLCVVTDAVGLRVSGVVLGKRAALVMRVGMEALDRQRTRAGGAPRFEDPSKVELTMATPAGLVTVYVSSAIDEDAVIPLYDFGDAHKLGSG